MIYLDEERIIWKTGETKEFCIEYISYDGKKRTYRPDFIVGNKMIEIKPKRLHETPLVKLKAEAGIQKCKDLNLIYNLIDVEICSTKIEKALNEGLVRFAGDYEKRFRKYIAKVKPVKASC